MSNDLIKRSDAIEAVKRVSENYTGKGKRDYHPHVDFIVDELKYCVPSADRPQGESILQDTIRRLERVIKHGVAGKDGMHPVSAEVVLNWLKGADDEDN